LDRAAAAIEARDMKAIRLEEIGAPENLTICDRPQPEVGEDAVLIDVALAGLLYADTEQRRGTYYKPTILPHYPGREAAGVIARVGPAVEKFRPGQRVAALVLEGGCYAEQVAARTGPYTFPNGVRVPAADILVLPDRVGFGQGLVYLTNFRLAWMLYHDYARVAPGATVLIHGAAGGFGSVLTQIALEGGARVIALCRTREQANYAGSIGAQIPLNVEEVDYVAATLEATEGRGADFSLNGVGGATLDTDPQALRTFGEMIVYGYAGGKRKVDIYGISKSISIKSYSADDFVGGEGMKRATATLYEWFERRPLLDVSRVFPLAEAPAAHRWLEEGHSFGKVALKP
jgi:NADPH2:quinone reductase